MTEFGARRINKRPCTEAEMAQNMAVIDALIEEIQVAVSGGVVDNFTVNVTADDSTPSTLHDAINGSVAAGTYTAGRDPLITSNTVGAASTNQTELFFIDANAIPSYSNTGTWCLSLVNDVLTWVDGTGLGSGGGDNFTVKNTAGDAGEYLIDKFEHTATRNTDADPLVKAEMVDTAGVKSIQLFLDADVITGYSSIPDGEAWPLAMYRSGATRTIRFTDTFTGGSAGVTAGTYIDISGSEVSVDLREVDLHQLADNQFFIHMAGEEPKWATIEDYDDGETQYLGHESGDWKLFSKPTVLRWGRVTTEITAATTNAAADRGTGEVELFNDTTGVAEASITVDNLYPSVFAEDTVVCVDTKYDPPRIVGASCETLAAP